MWMLRYGKNFNVTSASTLKYIYLYTIENVSRAQLKPGGTR